MKISNSKKQLAQIIHENGGWRDGMSFSWYGNKTKMGYFGEWPPRFDKASGSMIAYGALGVNVIPFKCEKLPNWHQTILSRDEYFHLHPAPDADGWIEWGGGECPVEKGTMLDLKHRDGGLTTGVAAGVMRDFGERDASSSYWVNDDHDGDIIAYRLHKHEQAKPAQEPVSEAKPTIEQLAADYRNRKDYADRKQQEADAAKADADAKLAELVAAGAALGLALSVVEQEPEPELVITDWRDLRVGDEVEVECRAGVLTGFITEMEPNHYDGERPFRFQPVGYSPRWCTSPVFRFIRRPAKGEANA